MWEMTGGGEKQPCNLCITSHKCTWLYDPSHILFQSIHAAVSEKKLGVQQGAWWRLVRRETAFSLGWNQLECRAVACLDAEENSDTSVLIWFSKRAWSETFWKQRSEDHSAEGHQQRKKRAGCQPQRLWGTEAFEKGDGPQVPTERRALGCAYGCGGPCHMSFLWVLGNVGSHRCCKPLDIQKLHSLFICVCTNVKIHVVIVVLLPFFLSLIDQIMCEMFFPAFENVHDSLTAPFSSRTSHTRLKPAFLSSINTQSAAEDSSIAGSSKV